MTTITEIVQLPWATPPLSMNDRMHWAQKAKITAGIRRDTGLFAEECRLPRGLKHVQVSLHYRPRDRRRRDADNLVPILKACCDGLVDYGLIADDTPDQMHKLMPVIEPAEKGSGGTMWLELTWEGADAVNERQQPAHPAGTNT